MEFETWQQMATAIIRALQLLITAGIGFRCIVIIQKGREAEAPWKQIWQQIKGHVGIAVLAIGVTEIIDVIAKYFGGKYP